MATYYRILHQALGTEIIVKAQVVVGVDHSAHASNYWTFTLTRVPVGEDFDFGETIGTALSTQYRSLVAGEAETLYDDPAGFELADGERLVLKRASTGTPTTPTDAKVVIERQRNNAR